MALLRILNVPARGVGAETVRKLRVEAGRQGISVFEVLKRIDSVTTIAPKTRDRLRQFRVMIDALGAGLSTRQVSDILKDIVERTGYYEYLEREGTFEAKVRVENVREFFGAVWEFESLYNEGHVAGEPVVHEQGGLLHLFLEKLSLETDFDRQPAAEESVKLMTLHTAKGLEFEVVFMVGLEEEIFPHVNSLNAGDTELEEERRLCYVGITRAQEKLHLSYAERRRLYGYQNEYLPSRFLKELPTDCLSYNEGGWQPTYDKDFESRRRRILYG